MENVRIENKIPVPIPSKICFIIGNKTLRLEKSGFVPAFACIIHIRISDPRSKIGVFIIASYFNISVALLSLNMIYIVVKSVPEIISARRRLTRTPLNPKNREEKNVKKIMLIKKKIAAILKP